MTEVKTTQEWFTVFPPPRSKAKEITANEVMQLFEDMDLRPEPKSFLLVDVRKNDWEGGTIKTSLNLPAQSFYQTRKTLLDLCDRAGIRDVIFFCGSCRASCSKAGGSSGRGPRCAGWMKDYIEDIGKFGRKSSLEVLVLKGGIKGWVKEFEGGMMEGFEEGAWGKE